MKIMKLFRDPRKPGLSRSHLSRKAGKAAFRLIFPVLLAAAPWAGAQGRKSDSFPGKSEQKAHKRTMEDTGGELLLFQDIPQVISTGREATPLSLSPAPVSTLSSEEIKWTGLTSIPEMLRFLPGMDVVKIDRIHYAIGVHGLHSFWADRTLALIDGRNATHPAWGGTTYNYLPLMAEDIDRIEAVRGPIGATWGANAFNGAVNIITKKPEDAQGITFSEKINEYGDNRSFLRWGSKAGNLAWRLSSSIQRAETSSDAMTGENFESNDSYKAIRFSGRGSWKIGRDDHLSFGAAHAWNRIGDFEQFGYWVRKKGRVEMTRLFAKHEHSFESGGKGYIQAFCNREYDDYPSEGRAGSVEYDLEAQVSGKWIENHRLTVGGNYRFISVNSKKPRTPQEVRMSKGFSHEFWSGLFLSDRWTLERSASLDFQFRGDYYSETSLDWSARASWIQELDENKTRVFRFSLARSFRAPSAFFRQVELSRIPLAGGGYAYNIVASPHLGNENVFSIEGGYFWKPRENLSFTANTYYQFMDGLISREVLSPTTVKMENSGAGRAYGGELEANWEVGPARLSGWFGYNGFRSRGAKRSYRSFRPADYKAGLKALVKIPGGVHAACYYRYSDAVQTPFAHHLPVMHTVDLTLSKVFLEGRATLQIGASDLFRHTDPKIYGLGSLEAHKTPGRTFFARLLLTF